MWKHRGELSAELEAHSIPEPAEAQQSHYEALLKVSRPWWELAQGFKTSRLPYGFRLVVAVEFGGDATIPANEGPGNGENQVSEVFVVEVQGPISTSRVLRLVRVIQLLRL